MAEYVPNRVPCSKKPAPTPPQPEPLPPVTLCDLTGVKYFKLQSDIPGDYTKNCGLLGNEIDENFYFLRSMDIKSAYTIDEEGRKILVLERVNCGREIKIDITQEQDEPVPYKFWEQDGHIWITTPDGETYDLKDEEGNPVVFLIEGYNVHIVTDASIQGDGSYMNPVSLDLAYRTGTYMPADFFVDLSCSGADITMFDDEIANGHSIVSKEAIGRFGMLYTYDEAEKINNALKGTGWRLPTKEDWGKLLNWAEEKDEYRNHITDQSGNFGCVAGARLRSKEYWKEDNHDGTDNFGFTIFPVGVCPEVNNTAEPTEYGFEKLYEVSTFWTSSKSETGEIYVRTFSYGHNDVAQFTESRKKRFSIRLVRDISSDFDIQDSEWILDNYVPIVPTTYGTQLWTKVNIGVVNYKYTDDEGNEIKADPRGQTVPTAWEKVETNLKFTAYYIYCGNTVDTATSKTYAYYEIIDKYVDLPSTATPISADSWVYEIEEGDEEPYKKIYVAPEVAQCEPYITLDYTIHMDMITEPRYFYSAWDGRNWHRKLLREGESVVLINEDYPNPCDTGATPYVTEDNKNHEWRVYVNEETGLEELIDTAAAIKDEFRKELKEIYESLSAISGSVETLSGFVGDMYDEMQSGFSSAFTTIADLQAELDQTQEAVGLSGDGTYIVIRESGITASAETIAEAIGLLDDATMQNMEDIQVLSGVVEDMAEAFDELQKEVDRIEDGVGLSSAGTYEMKTDTHYLNSATTVEGEIAELDEVAFSAMTEIEELQKRAIEPLNESIVVEVSGYTTLVGVQIDENDKHLIIGDGTDMDGDGEVETGLWFNGEFKLVDEDDEDFYN